MIRYRFIIIILLLVVQYKAHAQFTIREIEGNLIDSVRLLQNIESPKKLDINYYSAALARAQRRALLRSRNLVETNVGLAISQTSFGNWAKGGDNTFSGRTTFDFKYVHTRNKLTVESKLSGRFGMNIIDDKPFKNEDEFKIGAQIKWKIMNNWSYSGMSNLRSQFAKGYVSRSNKTLRSNFMAPGFFDTAFGFNYHKDKSPLNITLSPLTGSMILILDDDLKALGINGVEKGKSSKSMLGSSIEVNFNKSFWKEVFSVKSDFNIFYNYNIPANARWVNTFKVRATKVFTTSFYLDMIYDQQAKTPNKEKYLQFNYVLSFGIEYKFTNQRKF